MKSMHLISNAHIDPVWQWEFEEGVGAVLSTFRAAAEFCDEFEGYVFNHNEAMIYEWVETYDPELFQRIQQHVKDKKWHIMGSWYLQPDCNMPCGESIIRQIEAGKRYFKEKFGVTSNVAVNFDPFGHSRGLVQIMEQAGFVGYICCRPSPHEMYTPARECLWKGFNNSSIMVHRSDSYNQLMGRVDEKIEAYLNQYRDSVNVGMVLWGVGNHGGGPSRMDLKKIETLREKYPEISILHSTPEAYFEKLEQEKDTLYTWDQDLNPTMRGCYTSQVRIKQTHSRLENELYLTEKMCVHAELAAGIEYPDAELKEAQSKLLFSEFHDILPGSSIQKVEDQGLEIMHHGLDLLRTIKARAFFSLCREQKKAAENTYPVFVYNPHPFAVTDVFEAEFMLADQNYDTTAFDYTQVYSGQETLPSQCIKERSNLPIQWRKRTAFHATLQPFSVNRFDIRVEKRPFPAIPEPAEGALLIANGIASVKISRETGLIDSYKVQGVEYAAKGFGALTVFEDNEDPWGMTEPLYSRNPLGSFTLVHDKRQAAKIAAASCDEILPVRIIEYGDVMIKAEAIFEYENSAAIVHYILNQFDSTLKIAVRIINTLKNRMIKWMLPMGFDAEDCCGKTMFGVNQLDMSGKETISQEYLVVSSQQQALSVIKPGCYGAHFKENVLGLSLLRGAAYCAHPIGDRKTIPSDRFVERMDQGERFFSFVLNASDPGSRMQNIERECSIVLQTPQIVSYFPDGKGEVPRTLLTIDNPCVSVSALKKAADGIGYILRLYNGSEKTEEYHLKSEIWNLDMQQSMQAFEIRTLLVSHGSCVETTLIDLNEISI